METHSLTALAAEQIAVARSATNGRGARTIHGGRDRTLRQTVLGLAAGHGLADHEAPGEATLQVLTGHVRLSTAERVVGRPARATTWPSPPAGTVSMPSRTQLSC